LRTTVGYCEARVAPYSIYAVLNRECFTLFPDELFADLFTDVGRRRVPPIANDGLVSISSLLVGVAASGASTGAILTAGIAGLAAGAMAMAADEYVSVSAVRRGARRLADRDRRAGRRSRRGAGRAHPDLPGARGSARARRASRGGPARGRPSPGSLGHHESTKARPGQAAGASATSFTIGGLVPFLGILATSQGPRLIAIVAVTIVGLAVAGVLGARAAGTTLVRPTLRVLLGGTAAMIVTAAIGQIAHVSGL